MKQSYWYYLLTGTFLVSLYLFYISEQSYAQSLISLPATSEALTIYNEDTIPEEDQLQIVLLQVVSPITSIVTATLQSTVVLSPSVTTPEPSLTPSEPLSIPTALPVTQSAISTPTTQVSLPEETNILSLTLAELGYENVTLSGLSDDETFEIGLPTHWEKLPGSSLSLFLNYSGLDLPLPTPESASTGPVITSQTVDLEVTLNDEPIYQTKLTSFGSHSLAIPLPDTWPERTGDRDSLKILTRIEGVSCEDIIHGSVTVLNESFLTVVYRPGPLSLDLALYPSPIYQRTFSPSMAYIILPDQPSRLQVEAGLSLAAGLGHLTDNNLMITTTIDSLWDEANPLREHLILVGTPDSNSLISYLNDTTALPASLRLRRLNLTISGPDVVAPNTDLTYVLQITNTEASSTALRLQSRLPEVIKNITCQPNCQKEATRISWDISPLAPNATSFYTFTFALPTTATLEAIDLTSELIRSQEIVNVSTLRSPVQLNITPTLTHTEQTNNVFFVQNGQAIPETDGIIEFLPSPWQPDKAILLVTGLTDEAVFKAGRALGATAHFPGMQGQLTLVQGISQQLYMPLEPSQDITLADLGYEDRVIDGVGQRDIFYHFDLPLNWRLTEEATVRFLFSHSELLDPTRSSLNLIFNNTPIASVALDEGNAVAGELIALLPPQSARPGQSNRLLARIEMSLPDPCADPDAPQSWVTFSSASSLFLPHVLNDLTDRLDLDFLPLPFTTQSNLADVLFALPEQPSVSEYNATIRIAFQLAAASEGDNFHPVVLLGNPANADVSASHLIVVGRPSRSPLLQLVNEMLPQPFLPQTDTIRQQVDEIVFRLPTDLDLGYLQLIPSNWSSNRVLLAVTGTSDIGVDWAVRSLIDSDRARLLEGNLALLRGEEIFVIDTRKLTSKGKVATIATAVPETTIVGTATPTPRPTPLTITQTVGNGSGNTPLPVEQKLPSWLPLVIAGSIIIILIILGIAYWQSRRRRQPGL